MKTEIINMFTDYCRNKYSEELDDVNNIYFYNSLSVCIIDCVYSLRSKYIGTTIPTVQKYADAYLKGDLSSDSDSVSKLISRIQEKEPEPFAREILDNMQKSGGRLKTEICLELAEFLKFLGIETVRDFKAYSHVYFLEHVILSVKGIGNAGMNYLFMLAGDQNRCKPDTHIRHCVRDACDVDLSDDEYQELFRETVQRLTETYPNLTVSRLDNIIWRAYNNKKK